MNDHLPIKNDSDWRLENGDPGTENKPEPKKPSKKPPNEFPTPGWKPEIEPTAPPEIQPEESPEIEPGRDPEIEPPDHEPEIEAPLTLSFDG